VVQHPLPLEAAVAGPIDAPSTWRRISASLLRRALGVDLVASLGETSDRIAELSKRVGSLPSPGAVQYAAPEFSSTRNSVSRAVSAMRAKEKESACLTLDDYRRCFGDADLTTEDDRFLAYILRDTPLARPPEPSV
jgi:hypothetical protein